MTETKVPIPKVLETPPRTIGNDPAVLIDWLWRAYQVITQSVAYINAQVESLTTTSTDDLPDPATSTVAQAQQTANDAFALADQADQKSNTNTSNITTNSADILALQANVATNTTDIATNTADIAAIVAATGQAVVWAVDEQASATAPSAATTGAWTKRSLGTTKLNNLTGASIAAGVITLPAGTYDADAAVIVHNASGVSGSSGMARLRDTTNGVTLALGTGSGIGLNTGYVSVIKGTFTLAGVTDIELQYYCQATGAPKLGFATSNGDMENWASVHLKSTY